MEFSFGFENYKDLDMFIHIKRYSPFQYHTKNFPLIKILYKLQFIYVLLLTNWFLLSSGYFFFFIFLVCAIYFFFLLFLFLFLIISLKLICKQLYYEQLYKLCNTISLNRIQPWDVSRIRKIILGQIVQKDSRRRYFQ